MWIVWSRESAAVLFASPERTSGRIPTKTLEHVRARGRAVQVEARRSPG